MRNSSVIGRVAAVAALAIAIIAVTFIVLSSGSTYTVGALFTNASQIVTGDQVEVGGIPIGSVSKISLTGNGQARLTLSITQKSYQPLREGTQATIRETSLSGVANRYVALTPGSVANPEIPDNGVIAATHTTSQVDLDLLFNTLNAPTLKGLQDVIQGSASQFHRAGAKAQVAFAYLNPAIAASSALFAEINRNTGQFTSYIVKTDNLVTALASRSSDLSGLVSHLSTTTGALAAQRTSLAQSLQRLPGFMRLANTTFVNLRSALDDLKPLVDATKPVAPKLEKLLVQLRPLARNSVPTLDNLVKTISRPGPDNDLIDLIRLGVPLAAATVRPVDVDGKVRQGAFPETTRALNESTPELATARPYAVDLTGWFEGYAHPGTIDANGGSSRIAPVIGVGSIQNGTLSLLPAFSDPTLRSVLAFGGTGSGGHGLVVTGQGDRCPGSAERGAVYYPESGFPCNPSEVPTGR